MNFLSPSPCRIRLGSKPLVDVFSSFPAYVLLVVMLGVSCNRALCNGGLLASNRQKSNSTLSNRDVTNSDKDTNRWENIFSEENID